MIMNYKEDYLKPDYKNLVPEKLYKVKTDKKDVDD